MVRREIVELHSAVFLFGFAGLFGKFLSISPVLIVFGRVLFASIFLYMLLILRDEKRSFSWIFVFLGVLLALHWLTFFASIQLSTVAIGLLTYSTFPVFTTLLEPVFSHQRFSMEKIFLALVVFTGVLIMLPSMKLNGTTLGVVLGTISGFLFSLLTLVNRRYVREHSGLTLAFYQDFFSTIFLLPFIFFFPFPGPSDWALLLLLGVVFTGVAHVLFISSLRGISAHSASVVAMLEPVYGIVLAFLLLSEVPSLRTILGGMVILSACLYATAKSA